MQKVIDPWFERELICPRDISELVREASEPVGASGHRYPIIKGVPVMLYTEGAMTMPKAFALCLERIVGRDLSAWKPETNVQGDMRS